MVVFDQAGSQKWSQPNYTPQIATSDNGVVAQSTTGQYVPLDQLGSVTGQMPYANPTVSWTNNVYKMAPVIQVSCGTPPPPAAPPYANFQQSNPSHNSAAAICGNESITLVLEYTTFDFAYPPFCGDFTSQSSNPQPAPDFGFTALNVSENNHYPNWGLFTKPLLDGLETFLTNYKSNNNQALCNGQPGQSTFCINSAYRSPYVQLSINSISKPNDPHVYGKAADIYTGDSPTAATYGVWLNMRQAAKNASACVEPWEEQGKFQYTYIHVDWGRACPDPDSQGYDW